ncbi:MAG: hypothetical protein ACLVBP_15545 [Ruminococcus sp.]
MKRQLADLQKQDPEQERLKKIHEVVHVQWKTEIYLKDTDKYAWLLMDFCGIFRKRFGKNMLEQLRL